jgi:hemerythrin
MARRAARRWSSVAMAPMGQVVNINQKIERATAELLAKHQAIIDAWYAKWLKREKARIDAAFRRGSRLTNGERND